MDLGTAWTVGLTGLKAVMAVIPNVTWWYFPAFVIPGIWLAFFGGLFLYISILRGRDDRVLHTFTNVLWLANVLATLAFILTRESPLHALGFLLVSTAIFVVAFANFAYAYRQLYPSEIWWKRWLGAAIAVGILSWGFFFDVNFNLTWGRAMFLQKPRLFNAQATTPWLKVLSGEYTFTDTLQRNVLEGLTMQGEAANLRVGVITWQGALAYFLCRRVVEFWDPNHCGLATRARG